MILCFFVCLFDLLCFSFFLSPCLPWADMLCLLATFAPFTFPISLQLAVNVPTICVPDVDRGYDMTMLHASQRLEPGFGLTMSDTEDMPRIQMSAKRPREMSDLSTRELQKRTKKSLFKS